MAGLPRTAVGIIGLVIFVGWLVALVYVGTPGATNLQDEINQAQAAQMNIANSAKDLTGSSGLYGSITAVFSVAFNLIVVIFSFFLMIFSSIAGFTSMILGIPFLISGIFLALLMIGLMFAIISKIVEI